jgi:olefin beta-lactone synthetase
MNVAELFEEQARIRPDTLAIIDVHRGRDRMLNFGELHEKAARWAALLDSQGIEPGSYVLIFQPMTAELYVFLLALLYLGAVSIFLDSSAGRDYVERCCETCPPKAFFGSARSHLLRLVSPAIRRIPLFYGSSWQPGSVNLSSVRSAGPLKTITSVDGNAPALITFTSGSTGTPKAAVRTHNFLRSQHRALAATLHLIPGAADLTTLPIFVLANLATGVCSILPDSDMREPALCDAVPIIKQIERHRVSSIGASPALIERLADQCIRNSCPLLSLDKVFLGGAPVFPRVLQRARIAFPNAALTTIYGSTEAEPMAVLPFDSISEDDFDRMRNGRGLLAGTPSAYLQLRVIRDHWGKPVGRLDASKFAEMMMPTESPGEIVVSGEHVLGGYLHGDGEWQNKIEVSGVRWHRTGDLGYFDSKTRLWLLGRCSAKIEDQGGSLYPLAVECAAQHDPRIARAAVVEVAGERVLVLQAKKGHELDSHYKEKLAWAHLDRVLAISNIPVDKRHNAKIDYPQLRSMLKRCGECLLT